MATFLWETEAACPIKETKDDSQVRKGEIIVFVVSTYWGFFCLFWLLHLNDKTNYSEV